MDQHTYRIRSEGREFNAIVEENTVRLDGYAAPFYITEKGNGAYSVRFGNEIYTVYSTSDSETPKQHRLVLQGRSINLVAAGRLDQILEQYGLAASGAGKMPDLKAPMPGLVRKILIEPGTQVEKGVPLLVLEAMKMENMIKATGSGTVASVKVTEGDKVEKGTVLISFS
jgi:biotin carboxyl carrier protein